MKNQVPWSSASFETMICDYSSEQLQSRDAIVYAQRLKSSAPLLDELVYLKNDFELTKNIDLSGILKSFEMKQTDKGFVVYKEHFNGIPLVKFLLDWEFNVPQFVELAMRLTSLLEELHQRKLIVKELVIENILLNPETLEIKICSLGLASELLREKIEIQHEADHFTSLWHIAPEQTGRISRTIDYRSDYYALGVILYQIATGRKPFNYEDSFELIYAHIAKKPVPPKIITEELPDSINNIILKLMAKNAEDRYQSEKGILLDLKKCKQSWKKNGVVDDFELGAEDHSNIFTISEKLYGRAEELKALTSAWKSVINNNSSLALVAGRAGVGKTRLIQELRATVFEDKGYFVNGKYDILNRDTPYTALMAAIKNLVQLILSETDEDVAQWKAFFLEHTDNDIAFLIEQIPEVQQLFDKEFELVNVGPVEGQKRFTKAFIEFLEVLDLAGKPLFFFIDDLQWADNSSVNLMTDVLGSGIKNILFCGAFRDDEIDPSAPFALQIRSIEQEHPEFIKRVPLKELERKDISLLLADSFGASHKSTKELSKLVRKKTQGNPFFVKEFLQELVMEQLIYFSYKDNNWEWDLEKIENFKISDYVVDILLNRIEKLSSTAKNVLSLAACVGSTFDSNILALISQQTPLELSGPLWELTTEDYINPVGNFGKFYFHDMWKDMGEMPRRDFVFKFQHDRIQQAAYSIIPEEKQKEKHYMIGQLLYSQMSDSELEENLFDILNHFLIGKDSIQSKKEKERISALCLKAGKKAIRNNVLEPANNYFTLGMELLDDQERDDFKELLIGRSESAYLLGDYETSESLFDQAVENADTKLQKADILSRKMALYENTQRHELAIDTARKALKYVGMTLPKKTNTLHVMGELLKVKFLLRNKSTDQLLNNERMESPEKIVIMKTLMNLWGPAYLLQKQELLAFKILRMVNLSIRFGNSIESALAYAFYGYVISAQLKDYDKGCEFAAMGMRLNQNLDDKSLRSKVIVIAEGCVASWNRPYASMVGNLLEAFKVGVESNDIIYAGYATTFMNRFNVASGMKLPMVLEESKPFLQFVSQVNATISRQQILPWSRFTHDLMGKEMTKEIFRELINEEDHLSHLIQLNDEMNLQLPLANYYTSKAIYHYIFNNYKESYDYSIKADPLMNAVLGLMEWQQQIVFKTLAGLSCWQDGQVMSRKEKRGFASNIKTMKKWSEVSPINFKAEYLIANGEREKCLGNLEMAESNLQEAVREAKISGNLFISAVAHERLSHFYSVMNRKESAQNVLRKSIVDYHEWGAIKKAEQLQDVLKPGPARFSVDSLIQRNLSSTSIDLQSILLAAQTLSGEVRKDKLMDKLLLILIKNAGAQNVHLIRHDKSGFYIEASSRMKNNNTLEMNHTPLAKARDIAPGIVRQVYNTKLQRTIHDVEHEKQISADIPLNIKAHSILCMPIVSQNEAVALIYMDNHLSKNVFNEERLQLLEMLSSQIAISLENADLYENLEERVRSRTKTIEEQKVELENSKKQSDNLLSNILPDEIAGELKQHGSSKPRRYEAVTIMFTDFVRFTKMSEKLTPEELVEFVDEQYKGFDTIIEKYGIEKIKTIGDSYMCVAGLPQKDEHHAQKAVQAALEISKFVEDYIEKRKAKNLPYCEMRIGLNSGPVIAGVVGHKKFAYDIWGDAVNIASRMESACEEGKVNLSNATYELVKDQFNCVYRGKVEAKNKGHIEMYYID